MGGDTTTQSPLRGPLWNPGRAPERVVNGGEEEGEVGGSGQTRKSDGREDNSRTRQDGEGGDRGEQEEDAYGSFQLG